MTPREADRAQERVLNRIRRQRFHGGGSVMRQPGRVAEEGHLGGENDNRDAQSRGMGKAELWRERP
jgi:hypothetical protein